MKKKNHPITSCLLITSLLTASLCFSACTSNSGNQGTATTVNSTTAPTVTTSSPTTTDNNNITPPTTTGAIETSGDEEKNEHMGIFGGINCGRVIIDDNDYFCKVKVKLPEDFGREGEDRSVMIYDSDVHDYKEVPYDELSPQMIRAFSWNLYDSIPVERYQSLSEGKSEPTAADLVNGLDRVFEGKVTNISFAFSYDVELYGSGEMHAYCSYVFYTIYEITPTATYKGDLSETVTIYAIGGHPTYKVEEQKALATEMGYYGEIPIYEESVALLGEDYLFVSTDNTLNRSNGHVYQFAFQPTGSSSDDGMPSYENVWNYLKEYLKK